MDEKKREKVIFAIENCLTTDSVTECRKTECPFISCRESCLEWLLRSALALLKEQEARVMTVEEVRDCVDYVWAEIFTPMNERRCLIYCLIGQNQGYSEVADLDEDSGQSWARQWDNYGKTWRCWTSRPTDKERRDTKWEEDSDAE